MAIVLPPTNIPQDTDQKSAWPAAFRAWAAQARNFLPLAWSETPEMLVAGSRELVVAFAASIGLSEYQIILELDFRTTWEPVTRSATGFTVRFGDDVPAGGGQAHWRVLRYL